METLVSHICPSAGNGITNGSQGLCTVFLVRSHVTGNHRSSSVGASLAIFEVFKELNEKQGFMKTVKFPFTSKSKAGTSRHYHTKVEEEYCDIIHAAQFTLLPVTQCHVIEEQTT